MKLACMLEKSRSPTLLLSGGFLAPGLSRQRGKFFLKRHFSRFFLYEFCILRRSLAPARAARAHSNSNSPHRIAAEKSVKTNLQKQNRLAQNEFKARESM